MFSRDVMTAIFVSQNNEIAAMLVSPNVLRLHVSLLVTVPPIMSRFNPFLSEMSRLTFNLIPENRKIDYSTTSIDITKGQVY